ncbi:hypothetical protein PTSG_02749 [Salpingoeca rosetta]|uniref:GATA-type domain-containing protein n=1 Tax=Salpingoeca rosetta (strain ATCC 50818 / BSB-021) TaxID=946362 RepID=F2U374_SALR5|nr:uncharacterized protein PTSG_02749 [Salpingoeca rosetta]EGD82068.1 hypothetical protein PTSG_02749 [Salpingoeca rosetta]|eukprot:XP_004996251.1 hypothetical protein PTSG_02749 [Salpingoeca rosetta]
MVLPNGGFSPHPNVHVPAVHHDATAVQPDHIDDHHETLTGFEPSATYLATRADTTSKTSSTAALKKFVEGESTSSGRCSVSSAVSRDPSQSPPSAPSSPHVAARALPLDRLDKKQQQRQQLASLAAAMDAPAPKYRHQQHHLSMSDVDEEPSTPEEDKTPSSADSLDSTVNAAFFSPISPSALETSTAVVKKDVKKIAAELAAPTAAITTKKTDPVTVLTAPLRTKRRKPLRPFHMTRAEFDQAKGISIAFQPLKKQPFAITSRNDYQVGSAGLYSQLTAAPRPTLPKRAAAATKTRRASAKTATKPAPPVPGLKTLKKKQELQELQRQILAEKKAAAAAAAAAARKEAAAAKASKKAPTLAQRKKQQQQQPKKKKQIGAAGGTAAARRKSSNSSAGSKARTPSYPAGSRTNPNKRCKCCGCNTTPLWRDFGPNLPLCNACGIRFKKYGCVCRECIYVPCKQESSLSYCKRCKAKRSYLRRPTATELKALDSSVSK